MSVSWYFVKLAWTFLTSCLHPWSCSVNKISDSLETNLFCNISPCTLVRTHTHMFWMDTHVQFFWWNSTYSILSKIQNPKIWSVCESKIPMIQRILRITANITINSKHKFSLDCVQTIENALYVSISISAYANTHTWAQIKSFKCVHWMLATFWNGDNYEVSEYLNTTRLSDWFSWCCLLLSVWIMTKCDNVTKCRFSAYLARISPHQTIHFSFFAFTHFAQKLCYRNLEKNGASINRVVQRMNAANKFQSQMFTNNKCATENGILFNKFV